MIIINFVWCNYIYKTGKKVKKKDKHALTSSKEGEQRERGKRAT